MSAVKTDAKRAASGREIFKTLGDMDAETASAILDTKVTQAELVQVREWMEADPIVRSQLRHGAQGSVRAVCEILDQAEAEEDR